MDLLAIEFSFDLMLFTHESEPYWWGKVICLWAGLSWTGFAAMTFVLAEELFRSLDRSY